MKSKKCAEVNKERCVSCGACAEECPKAAISIWKGCYAVVDTDMCVGCGKCVQTCPTRSIKLKLREESNV